MDGSADSVSTMLSASAAEQAVFFATHEIEPNDERLLLRYKKELAEIPLWILFLRPKSRQPLALQRLRTAGVPNFVWNRHKIGAQLLFAGPLSQPAAHVQRTGSLLPD